MYIGQTEKHKVGPYVSRPGQILEKHNNLCSSARSTRPRNIKWVLMFLSHVRSLRNIMTYVPRSGQEAEKYKVGHYVPWLRNISTQFVNPTYFFVLPRSPHSSAPRCLLPTHWPPQLPAPHAPGTPVLPWPRPTGHAPPYPDSAPPCLGRAPAARQRALTTRNFVQQKSRPGVKMMRLDSDKLTISKLDNIELREIMKTTRSKLNSSI
jgi:hypothetical protein